MTSAMGRESTPTNAGNGAATDSGGQLQQAATGLMDQAARTADAQASTRMTMVGDTLDGIAQAIDDAAERLREQQPELAGLTATAADRLQAAATYLRDHNASEALQGVQQYARQQPALVVGGGLLAGLLLGRFLRAGASVAQAESRQRRLGSGSRYGYGPSAGTSYEYGSDYASSYGTDTSQELVSTDAAAAGRGTGRVGGPVDTEIVVSELEVEPIDDLGGTSSGSTAGTSNPSEGR
jgi:hypothetical protein